MAPIVSAAINIVTVVKAKSKAVGGEGKGNLSKSSGLTELRYDVLLSCLGYLHPHNPRGRIVAVPAFVLVFSLVFNHRDQ